MAANASSRPERTRATRRSSGSWCRRARDMAAESPRSSPFRGSLGGGSPHLGCRVPTLRCEPDHGIAARPARRIGRTSLAFRIPDPADSRPTMAASSGGADLPQLTATQRRILVALCRPYKQSEFAAPATNGQIAEEVFLSVDAVKAHLRALFAAFGIDHLPQNQKRAALAIRALQEGVVSRREL